MTNTVAASINPTTSGPDDNEAYFQSRLPVMVSAAERLIEAESPSNDVAALNRCADTISSYVMESLGRAPSLMRSGPERRPHLRLDLGSRTDILLIGHFDTVHAVGSLAHNPIRFADGRLYGPGALDMKSGLVSMVEVAKRLQAKTPNPNVTLFFNSDEEIGSVGSGPLLREVASRARIALIFDYGDNSKALRNGARGVRHVEVVVKGKGGHAAYPERNRNPIEGVAKLVAAAAEFQRGEEDTAMSPTRLRGSEADNVVTDTAMVMFDLRGKTDEQLQAREDFLRNFDLSADGLETDITVLNAVSPFPVTEDNEAAHAAIAASKALGWPDMEFTQERGASDANAIAPVINSILVGFGGWGDGAHSSEREYIDVESIVHFSTLGTEIAEIVLENRLP